MAALVLRDFGDIAVQQVPRVPVGPNDVEIAVCLTGICGSDVHGYTGENGRRIPGQIMGHESEGFVSAIGADVVPGQFGLGRRVTFNPVVIPQEDAIPFAGREQHSPRKYVIGVRPDLPAAFAEYIVVPSTNVVEISDVAPIGAGALIEPLAVAVHAVKRAAVLPGQRAFVVGGGPIGQSVVIALKLAGVEQVIVSETDPRRRQLLAKLGALPVDPRESDSAAQDLINDVWGELADVAFDAVGLSVTLASALSAVSLGGTVCLVGMGEPSIRLDAFAVSTAERSIVGSFTYSREDFLNAASCISQPGLGIEFLISEVVTPDGAPEAFAQLARAEGPPGKVLVNFDAPLTTPEAQS